VYNEGVIYFFHGSDTTAVRAKAFAWVAAARAKRPDAAYIRLSADDLTENNLSAVMGTQGLFFLKTLVLIDEPFSTLASSELLITHLPALAESPNPIAILAPNLLAARAKKVSAHAEKEFVCDAPKKASRGFNAALVEAFAAGKRELLWTEIMRALRAGDAPEMLHGLLHFKARELMRRGASRGRALSRTLILLIQDARQGGLPLAQALERFALTMP
jgi:DNA polymerase III delta subunit